MLPMIEVGTQKTGWHNFIKTSILSCTNKQDDMELNEMHCKSLPKGTLPLVEGEIKEYLDQLSTGWEIIHGRLKKEFPFENFNRGVVFINDIATIAETENHHPDIGLHYSKVEVEFYTHSIGGLSVNDFIMASKIDEI